MTMIRPPYIATVCVLGATARPKDNRERLELVRLTIEAVLARPGWQPIDAVLFPGGFFRLNERLGHGDFAERVAVLDRQSWMPHLRSLAAEADRRMPGIVIAFGCITSRGKHETSEQVCVAVSPAGVVAIARKLFPTFAETSGKRPLIPTYRDYAAPDRYLSLANGSRAVLCACYDGFGLAESPRRRTVRTDAIRYLATPLGVLSRADPTFQRMRAPAIGFWHERFTAEQPRVALVAIHSFHGAGLDGFWQRHGIASASAALGGGLVTGAAHFSADLPRLIRSTLSASNVPGAHLDDGLHRKAHRLTPRDGFVIAQQGAGRALVRLFTGTFHEQ